MGWSLSSPGACESCSQRYDIFLRIKSMPAGKKQSRYVRRKSILGHTYKPTK